VIITRRYFNALAATSAFVSSIAANRANALAWPTRLVHLVVPFAAGGPTDVIVRIVGERLSKGWGQQVLIENRPYAALRC
jgi:tripartite-type tricarboxylate transporter receptor subunit TctC